METLPPALSYSLAYPKTFHLVLIFPPSLIPFFPHSFLPFFILTAVVPILTHGLPQIKFYVSLSGVALGLFDGHNVGFMVPYLTLLVVLWVTLFNNSLTLILLMRYVLPLFTPPTLPNYKHMPLYGLSNHSLYCPNQAWQSPSPHFRYFSFLRCQMYLVSINKRLSDIGTNTVVECFKRKGKSGTSTVGTWFT